MKICRNSFQNMLFLAIFCYFALQNKEDSQENMLVIEGLFHFTSFGGNSGQWTRGEDREFSRAHKKVKEGLTNWRTLY